MSDQTKDVRHARAGSLILTIGERYRWRGCRGTFLYGGKSGTGEVTKIVRLSRERPKLGTPMFHPGDTIIYLKPDDGPEARFQPGELEFAPLDEGDYQVYIGIGFD